MAALPFDIVRLAGVLGRCGPIPIALGLTRQCNPELWKALEAFGIDRLAVQGTRERELANVYRGNDAARELDDEHFAQMPALMKQALDMAVEFSRRAAHAQG